MFDIFLLPLHGLLSLTTSLDVSLAPVGFVDDVAVERSVDVSNYFETLELSLHARGVDDSVVNNNVDSTVRDINECKSVLASGLRILPSFHTLALNDLTLNFEHEGKRGLAGAGNLIIRCDVATDAELLAVFIHEMGHVVDGAALSGNSNDKTPFVDLKVPVPSDDISSSFYMYSWSDNETMNSGLDEKDFCSTYGMTDPYEDFAECYVYYVLHGNEFRLRLADSPVLKQKYDFMSNYVFFGRKYAYDANLGNNNYVDNLNVVYDITKVAYNYNAI